MSVESANLDVHKHFDGRSVVSDTATLLRRHGLIFALMGLPFVLIPQIIAHWLDTTRGPFAIPAIWGPMVVSFATSAWSGIWLGWIMLVGASHLIHGRREPALSYFAHLLPSAGRVMALTLVKDVAVSLASVFLLFPGLIVLTAWQIALPALLCEKRDLRGALRRSSDLTRGSRWRIFGLVAVYFIAAMIVSAGGEVIISGGKSVPEALQVPLIGYGFSPVTGLLAALIAAPATCAMYVETLRVNQTASAAAAAEVFS